MIQSSYRNIYVIVNQQLLATPFQHLPSSRFFLAQLHNAVFNVLAKKKTTQAKSQQPATQFCFFVVAKIPIFCDIKNSFRPALTILIKMIMHIITTKHRSCQDLSTSIITNQRNSNSCLVDCRLSANRTQFFFLRNYDS